MMACRFINLRVNKLIKEGSVGAGARLMAGATMKMMQDIAAEFKSLKAMVDWLGARSSLQASVEVGIVLFTTLYNQRNQFGATQSLPRDTVISVQRLWNMICLLIEIEPQAQVVKSKDAKDRLAWLGKQLDESLKRPLDQSIESEGENKKARMAADEVMLKRVEVLDPEDLAIIKRYDASIGVVPIEGPVKNRSVVTAHDVSSLAIGAWVNDAAIDAHLTLVSHTFNGLFEDNIELGKSPKCHAWSARMATILGPLVGTFGEKHLRQEWPPARFPGAVLQDVSCHVFPVHVGGNHWILMVLNKMDDGVFTLFCYSSLPGYDRDFDAAWGVISSWLHFKSNGAFDVRKPRVEVPSPQPKQDNSSDCGVFVCGTVRWSLEQWDLSTLTSSIIPEYRRRMMLELEKWSLSTNRL